MDNLLPIVNKLQEIFARTKVPFNVDLPQIVVIGGQSSGKSSVLESIVGKDFLPRGTQIVTRCPIVIQLINLSLANSNDYAEFSHKPNERFYDFIKVKEEIEAQTNKIAGKNKGVTSVPIIIKIYAKDVIDLTLVDLPGICKNPTGDQPLDIEQQISKIVFNYTQNPMSLIMAVSPANNDIAVSDGLKIAK